MLVAGVADKAHCSRLFVDEDDADVLVTVSGGAAPITTHVADCFGMPPGLTYEASERRFRGTPTTAGVWSPVVVARDAHGLCCAARVHFVTVLKPPHDGEWLPSTAKVRVLYDNEGVRRNDWYSARIAAVERRFRVDEPYSIESVTTRDGKKEVDRVNLCKDVKRWEKRKAKSAVADGGYLDPGVVVDEQDPA